MAEGEATKTYRASCHCGAFIFEARAPEITSAAACNCSICTKKGYLWTIPAEPMTIVKGDGSLKEYTFGPKRTVHMFCPTCGTPVMCRNDSLPAGKEIALNVRTFQDLDIQKLERKDFDGQKLNPEYIHVAPVFAGPEPSAVVEGGKVYTGSCHCGAVTAAVKVEPLDDTYPGPILECTCSICQRGAYIWIYPKNEQVVVQGQENLSYYVFGSGNYRKAFCKTCGVHIMNDQNPLTEEEITAQPEASRKMRAITQGFLPVTLRILNGFDIHSVKTAVANGGKEMAPAYVNP